MAVDAVSGALVGVWLAVAALAAAVLAAAHVPPAAQVAVFAAVGALLLAAVRPLALRHRTAPLPPEALVGKLGSVVDPVDESIASGRVVIEGTPYVARCAPGTPALPAGAPVRVAAVEAGELLVESATRTRTP